MNIDEVINRTIEARGSIQERNLRDAYLQGRG